MSLIIFLSVILLTKTTSCGREETVFKSSLVYAFTKKISRLIHDLSFVIFNEFSYYIKPLNY